MAEYVVEEIIMDLYSITVYRNLEELRKIQDEREVNPFIFGNTKDNIDYCPEICVDISALIHLLLTNKSNIESACKIIRLIILFKALSTI